MVRINLINPKLLSDQHLLAEHVEILMLLSSARKFNKARAPDRYKLSKGHINFFKDKLLYLNKRFLLIQEEMRNRGYSPTAEFKSDWEIPKSQYQDYEPDEHAFRIIKARLITKLKMKLNWYTYYGKLLTEEQWRDLLYNIER